MWREEIYIWSEKIASGIELRWRQRKTVKHFTIFMWIVSHNLYFEVLCLFLLDTDMQMLTLTVLFTKLRWWFECSMLTDIFFVSSSMCIVCVVVCLYVNFLFIVVSFLLTSFLLMECSLMNVCFHSKWNIKMENSTELLCRPSVEFKW